jgi:DUF4097 and DUF4098 domain-containing protein YvlB
VPVCLAVAALLHSGPAFAGSRIAKTLDLGIGGRFVLNSKVGSVTLTGTSGSIVQVVITSERDDIESRVDFDFTEEPGVVRVTACEKEPNKTWWNPMKWGSDHVTLDYDIRVPATTDLDIDTNGGAVRVFDVRGTVRLESSGGTIGLRDLHGEVTAEAAGGDISLERITGRVHVSTAGGDIVAADVDGPLFGRTAGGTIEIERISGDVDVGALRGPVKVLGAGGHVAAKTAQGSLEVGFVAGNQSGGRLKASRGGIRVTVDRRANLLLDAHATGGRVRTDLPVRPSGESTESRLDATLGSGGERLILRTVGGSIVLDAI